MLWGRPTVVVIALLMVIPIVPIIAVPGEVAAQTSMCAGQEMAADPVRPVIYYGDGSAGSILVIDSLTGNTLTTVSLGMYPSSIDVSSDGQRLYVACPNDNCIRVIGLDNRTAYDSVPLAFSPLSVRESSPERLVVSDATGTIRLVDETTGDVVDEIVDPWWGTALEVNPAGDTFIATSIGTSPVKVSKYEIIGQTIQYLDTDNHDLGGNFRQQAVDWTRGIIYLASGAPYGLELVSVDTLDLTGFLSMTAYTAGVAISSDGTLVCGLASGFYESSIWTFNITHDLISTVTMPAGDAFMLLMDGAAETLFVGHPLTMYAVYPRVVPEFPSPEQVFSYTPASVRATVCTSLIPADVSYSDITVSDVTVTSSVEGDTIIGTIPSSLPDGEYTVQARIQWAAGSNDTMWSFVVDRTDALAYAPRISPLWPEPGTLTTQEDIVISAQFFPGDPPVVVTDVLMAVDGEPVFTEYDTSTNQTHGILSMQLGAGTHSVSVDVSWGPETVSDAWEFTVAEPPTLTPVSPAIGELLQYSPSEIVARLSPGSPPVEMDNITASVDGEEREAVYDETDSTIVIGMPWRLPDGEHLVQVTVNSVLYGTCDLTWSFSTDAFAGGDSTIMTPYDDPNGFTMMVPASWTVEQDKDTDGATVDLAMQGPIHAGDEAIVMGEFGSDSTVSETEEYLGQQMQDAIDALDEEFSVVYVLREAQYLELGGHLAVVFTVSIPWSDMDIEAAIIVSEEHQMYWIFMMSVPEDAYTYGDTVFETMMLSFNVTIEPTNSLDRQLTAIGFFAALLSGSYALGWATERVGGTRRTRKGGT